jgi:hypothetical protein
VTTGCIRYDTWGGWNRDESSDWYDWLDESGAVRIWPPMESSDGKKVEGGGDE